jgi:hypothetical protein
LHPLHPYAYEIQYHDGRRLRWDSPGGPWGEAQLPTEGVRRVLVLGHPGGTLTLTPVEPITGFVLRAQDTLTLPGVMGARRVCVGVRRGEEIIGWRIDARGEAIQYRGPLQGW